MRRPLSFVSILYRCWTPVTIEGSDGLLHIIKGFKQLKETACLKQGSDLHIDSGKSSLSLLAMQTPDSVKHDAQTITADLGHFTEIKDHQVYAFVHGIFQQLSQFFSHWFADIARGTNDDYGAAVFYLYGHKVIKMNMTPRLYPL